MSGLPFLSNSSFNHLQSDLVSPLKIVPYKSSDFPNNKFGGHLSVLFFLKFLAAVKHY